MLYRFPFFTRAYTRRSLFQLFMVCAFPIHVWTILMAFRDFSWVAERTNTWDAVGLLSYAMVFAFFETFGMFLILVLTGLFMPKGWSAEKRLGLLGVLYLILAVWAILIQSYSLNGYPLPGWVAKFLVESGHPLRLMWGGMFLVTALTVTVPVILLVRSEKAQRASIEIFDRLAILSSLYLLFDVVGAVVLVVRNIRA